MNGETKAGTPATAKDMRMLLLSACLILPPAFLYSLKSDLPHVFVITAAILAASLLKRVALPYSDRPIIYCSLAALALTALPDLLVPMSDDRFGILDIIIRSNLTAPAFLYLAAFATLFESTPHALGIVAALSVAVTLICGDFLAASRLANERTPFLDPLLKRYRELYVGAVMLQTLFLIFALSASRRMSAKGVSRKAAAARVAIKAACIAALPLLAIEGTQLYYANDKLLKDIERYFLRAGLNRRAPQGGVVFGKDVDLNATISPEMDSMRDQIVLRAASRTAPGYLRGRAYDSYDKGRWFSKLEKDVQLAATRRAEILSYNSFYLPGYGEASPERGRVDIYPDKLFSSDALLLPGNTFAIDAVADKISMSFNGVFETSQWKSDGACTARLPEPGQDSAFQLPSAEQMPEEYLAIPPELAEIASKFAAAAMPTLSAKPPEAQGDAEKVARLAGYFAANFSYSLSPSPPDSGVDPVAHFIQKSRKGHCELFASAATIALRSTGVPARYVTGFICEEAHPSGRYFVARLGNAHAWCEAYLRDQGRWVLVEATPPSELAPAKIRAWGPLEAFLDQLKQMFQQTFADIRRGYFAQAILFALEAAIGLFWSLVKTPAGLAALLAALAYMTWRKIGRMRKAARGKVAVPATLLSLKREMERLEKAVGAGCKSKRAASMTLCEWAAGHSDHEGLPGIVSYYESLRYRETPPNPEQVAEFRDSVNSFLKSGRAKPTSATCSRHS